MRLIHFSLCHHSEFKSSISYIHFQKVSYIADTTNLLLGLILYILNMKISGNPRGYESDEYIKYI